MATSSENPVSKTLLKRIYIDNNATTMVDPLVKQGAFCCCLFAVIHLFKSHGAFLL